MIMDDRMKTILHVLRTLPQGQADDYFVTETKRTSAQLFFIKKDLDQSRSTDTTSYAVSVYRHFTRDGQALTGGAECHIEEGMEEAEIAERVGKACAACVYAANPGFQFLPGVKATSPAPTDPLATQPLEKSALCFADALFQNDTQGDPWINSAEVFVTRKACRIVGSNGCDVSYVRFSADGEFVTQCRRKNDVEMHHTFAYDSLDTADLAEKVREALEVVVSRSIAEKTTPGGTYSVILSDKQVETLMEYYTDRASAEYIYPKYSNFAVGMDVMGETSGDRITMDLVAKEPFSLEGIPMTDRLLLDRGVLQSIQGNTRLCAYLGVPPTGQYRAARVSCGDMPFAEMMKGRVLRLVSFSDFQMDALSGYFGGEIRLGFLYENGTVTPVTGGSVSGNFIQLQKNICLSREQQKSSTFTGPKHMLLTDVQVSGK